jgi:hypothetical protein
MCPIRPVDDFIAVAKKNASAKEIKATKESIRKGTQPAFHMLNSYNEEFSMPISIAEFSTLFSVPIDYVKNKAEKYDTRLRLRSPYREHFAQAFARFFMRVGLPSDIPSFK